MQRNDKTFNTSLLPGRSGDSSSAKEIIMSVHKALAAKGYDPITQIVGYIISGDPTYITSYNNARTLIGRLERDEILEELVDFYVKNHTSN